MHSGVPGCVRGDLDLLPAHARAPRAEGFHHRFLGGTAPGAMFGAGASRAGADFSRREDPVEERLPPARHRAANSVYLDDIHAESPDHAILPGAVAASSGNELG